MSNNYIVYDLETQKTFAEVGGANKHQQLLVSYLGLYSYSQDKFFGFFEKDLNKLEKILLVEQPTIIGFNSISFDNNVLQPYFKQLQLSALPQIDILAEIYERLKYRIKLESVAQATLAEGKSGTGLDAIRYYRSGDLDSLARYCMDDVRLTRDLFDYGKKHGFILYSTNSEIRRLPVSWAKPITISKQLHQAFEQHKRIKIKYLFVPDEAKKFTKEIVLDILALDKNLLEAFSYNDNCKQKYQIDKILQLDFTGEQYAYQASLL